MYKWMYVKCVNEGFVVDRESVRILLKLLDPEGVRIRQRRRLRQRIYYNQGPNYLWHIDSNDKLKTYGIVINGCVDGFSRFLVCLRISGRGNSRTVGQYFISAVKLRQACPRLIRTDKGIENTVVKKMQSFLRRKLIDVLSGDKSVLCRDSRANQRIEFFWGVLRKETLQFWMDLFRTLREENQFSGDFLDKQLVLYCFQEIIQAELNRTIEVWNKHHIRYNIHSGLPNGKPFILYTLPHLYGIEDKQCEVEAIEIEACETECQKDNNLPCDENVFELCTIIMVENGWNDPTDAFEACELYQSLRRNIRQLL